MIIHPNQKVIVISKEDCKEDFLQVKNASWQEASNNLTYNAFKIYLYFASNQNGYSFALSYDAINELIPMHRNSHNKAIKELKDCGYLYQIDGRIWSFNDKL